MKWISACPILLLSFLLVQCKSAKTTASSPTAEIKIEDVYWKLTELNGQPVSNPGESRKEYFLQLKSGDKTVSAFAGCNGLGGNYELMVGNRLRFSQMISTMMACPELDTENAFKKVLETADNYTISGDMLSLNKAKMAPLAKFQAVKK